MLIEQLGEFLLRHPDLIHEIYDLLAQSPDPDATKRAMLEVVRKAKEAISDQAMREELELTRGR